MNSSVLFEWSSAVSVELCIGPEGARNRCFFANCQNYLMASLFLMSLFTTNYSLLVLFPSWSLTAFPGNWQRATNKAMLPAGYITSKLWIEALAAQRRAVRQNSGHYFQETGSEGNERILQKSESKYWSVRDRTLSPGTNSPLLGEWATYHVQPCLLDMECFSMMAVRRSREKRWSRFSWPAVWPLMWGDAVDGCGWCESWKLFHRSRLYRKDRQRSQSQRARDIGKYRMLLIVK